MSKTKQKRQLVGKVTTPPAGYEVKVPYGAITRAGHPCTKPAIAGKNRCRLHGGLSTGPTDPTKMHGNQNAKRHAMYSKMIFTEEEDWLEVLHADDDGMSLLTELDLARIQYLRAAVAQKKWLAYRHRLNDVTNDMIDAELRRMGVLDRYELHHHEGVKVVEGAEAEGYQIPWDDLKVVKKQTDYGYEMRRFGRLVDRLMRTEHARREASKQVDDVAKVAEDLQAFYDNAAALMPGGGMDPEDAAAE